MNKFLRFLVFVIPSAILMFVWFHAAQAAPTSDAPPVDPTTLSEILSQVLKLVAAVLMVVVPWLTHKIISAFETKSKIDIPQKQEDLINKWVEQGVHLAEEKARNWVKEKRVRMPGGAKAETALDYVWDMVQRSGIMDWTREMLIAKIDAKVNEKREIVEPAPLP
jgi:hypothetical protein